MVEIKNIPIGTEEIDWVGKFGVMAMNLSTLIYENVSGFDESEKAVIHIAKYDKPYNIEENDISILIRNNYPNVLFALYDDTYLVGYVTKNN